MRVGTIQNSQLGMPERTTAQRSVAVEAANFRGLASRNARERSSALRCGDVQLRQGRDGARRLVERRGLRVG